MTAVTALTAQYDALAEAGRITSDPAQRAAAGVFDERIEAITAMARRRFGLRRPTAPKGLYCWGDVGRGKTMLMDLAAEAMTAAGINVRRFHFHEFMAQVHDRVHSPAIARKKDPARHVAAAIADGATVLCFDEMEVRDIADAMIIARVIDGFISTGGVLIATSNRHPDDLYKDGLHRDRFLPFIALIKEKLVIHEIASSNDWRQQQLAGMPHWFAGPPETTRPPLEQAWDQLSGGSERREDHLTVAGRRLTIPQVAGSVAFASFDDLCGQPLAARDYLAIADRYAGLFLEGIPVMDDALQNEARRFMWLIDALYNQQRFLVASAEAEMAALYSGRQWQAEFPRTLSRLRQMTGNFVEIQPD